MYDFVLRVLPVLLRGSSRMGVIGEDGVLRRTVGEAVDRERKAVGGWSFSTKLTRLGWPERR
jgi:hypothetical protein